jgi:hypothetical protein
MLPVSDETFASFRYFNHIFFMPFIFLGLVVNHLNRKSSKFLSLIIFLLFLFLVIANFSSIESIAKQLISKSGSDEHVTILGEASPIVDYIIKNSQDFNEACLVGDKIYSKHFLPPFSYIASRSNFQIHNSGEKVPPIKPAFYLTENEIQEGRKIKGYNIEKYKKFGKIIVYKIAN